LSDPTAATGLPSPAHNARRKRKLSNYLLDKNLQLRYILLVTLLSAAISGALGYMIYDQSRLASESIERDLQVLTVGDTSRQEFTSILAGKDQALIYEMVGLGLGLVVILSAYLVIMTHKVAGPLFKVSTYFEQMAEGRLGVVTPLRRGDMLQDFFGEFKAMHESLRARAQADVAALEQALTALRDARGEADAAGRGKLDDAVTALDQHIAGRKKQLA